MTRQSAPGQLATYDSSNLQKHTNPNPLQKILISRFHRSAQALLGATGARTILDAGSGEGFAMREVTAQLRAMVVGLDASIGALQVARSLNPGREFASGDLLALPFADRQFDAVICLEVLEHLPDPAKGLAELERVSREWLVLSVPHEPFFRGANFARGKNTQAWGNDPGHVNHWSAQGFERFVGQQCQVVKRQQRFPWTILLARV
jgi:SAM-dependent methyltransferase